MNKENSNRAAAGLRRSAIAERIRLREEWSELKGTEATATARQNVLLKKQINARSTPAASTTKKGHKTIFSSAKECKPSKTASDVLCGVVALVEVGQESRALPLRAALAALGATVAATWSPLVTHLVWSDGGSRPTRAKARALGCKLVSPLWVEACAASATKLNERTFPTASRQSDLPSPRTLRQLLKRAEAENVPLLALLSDSKEDEGKAKPLRISTDTEQDTSADKTTDTSDDTIGVESRINTAPRRALPNPPCPTAGSTERPTKSRRKLFTNKEAELLANTSDDDSDSKTTAFPKQKRVRIQHSRLTHRDRKDLARAERMAKRILHGCNTQNSTKNMTQTSTQPRIVLTGMTRIERKSVTQAIQSLNGRIQNHVNKRTTHVILGSCRADTGNTRTMTTNHRSDITGVTNICDSTNIDKNTNNNRFVNNDINNSCVVNDNCNVNTGINNSGVVNTGINNSGVVNTGINNSGVVNTGINNSGVVNTGINNSGVVNTGIINSGVVNKGINNSGVVNTGIINSGVVNTGIINSGVVNTGIINSGVVNTVLDKKARTLNALLGAARGCRVLDARWAIDGAVQKKWLHHHSYEVGHLRKICQKARVERTALGRLHAEYAYDVFNGMRIRIKSDAEQKDAAIQLLKLCGADVQDGGLAQNGGQTQNGGRNELGRLQDGGRPQNGGQSDCDIIIGCGVGEIASKWVFDSVAAGRMRTTRKYVNSGNNVETRNRLQFVD